METTSDIRTVTVDALDFYTSLYQAVHEASQHADDPLTLDDVETVEDLLIRDMSECLREPYPVLLEHYTLSIKKHLMDYGIHDEKHIHIVQNRWISFTSAIFADLTRRGLYEKMRYCTVAGKYATFIVLKPYRNDDDESST